MPPGEAVAVGPAPWRPGPGQNAGAGALLSASGIVLVSAKIVESMETFLSSC